ncbi:uncharacterized protein BP5553_07985 [Venustampulla echinocandica]|uniref:Thioredoxin domain-containing protein n=1 Tax=Venustampulla echinocandica TaxID=2656787 RepID=A0A370TFE4_9HELO|nr:uncharacterized protein BP5553_07985 [Venustampulla echinocandica]RDL33617.1 hypothetical protein BP5553_07985 [Venustampulla echinocandica]
MRLLALPILCALFASVVTAESSEPKPNSDISEKGSTDVPEPTIFNGIEVPPLPEIAGGAFDSTVKDGYWFVKHHSPYCPHCLKIAPIWQTLYEFYLTSKPVPAGSSEDSASTSLNTFPAYYNFHFGSLDCSAFGDACGEHDVKNWPTFILYKDGKEVKRMSGPVRAEAMKALSDFVEDTLETIRPGSRPIGGPELPKAGAKGSSDLQAPASAPPKGSKKGSKGKSMSPSISTDVSQTKTKSPAHRATPVKKKPAKPASTPNPLGASVPFTAESFQNSVTMTQDPWLIKFYAPWCGHCQGMAPNWIQLAKEMKGRLNIGEVNCDVETRLCKDVRVRGYPSILFFRGGERVEYDGLRGLGDFVSYANKAIDVGDGVRDVDAEEFEELEESEEVIFVYFYDHATTSEDFAALERLTLSLIGHAKLVKTKDQALVDRFKITTWPRMLVSRDGRPTYYTGLTPQEMRDFRRVLHWMQSVWLPIVPELTATNSREIMNGKLVVLGILTRERPDEFLMAKKEIKSAALEWMDRQTAAFQRERQELRDAKQLRIEEAEDRNDQRALRAAKSIRINMDQSQQKEVGFAWVDGVFWERWIRTTYGIEVAKDGEKVIINDEDNRRYWDTTISGNFIMPSRTSILETIGKVVHSPPKIKAKTTVSSFEKLFFDIRGAISGHPFLSIGIFAGIVLGAMTWGRGRIRKSRGGFFKLDEKDGLLGGNSNGKVD